MENIIKFCPICTNVSERVIDKILRLATISHRKSGHFLYREGDEFQGFYVLKSGSIRLSVTSEGGKEILVKKVGASDVFGDTGLLEGKYLETAYLATEAEFVFLSDRAIREVLLESPELSNNLLASIGKWTMEFYLRFKTLSLPNAKDRIQQYLLAECKDSAAKVSLELKRHEIASNLGIRPETLSRVLAEMQAEGTLDINSNTIEIKNFSNLTD